jgi:hypothetical protein
MADLAKGWIMSVPVLSTSHLLADTPKRLLSAENGSYKVLEYDCGWFINVGSDSSSDTKAPTELLPVLEWFRMNFPGEVWIRFDADGDEITVLPRYNW